MHLIRALLKFLIFPQTLVPRHVRLTTFCYDSLYNFFFCINIVFSLVILQHIYCELKVFKWNLWYLSASWFDWIYLMVGGV